MRASLTELTVNVIEQLAMDCNTCKLQKPNSITFLMKIFFSPLFIQINIKKMAFKNIGSIVCITTQFKIL